MLVPVQVRNLKSCVKVAVDFLAPESVGQAVQFAQEFRNLGKQEQFADSPPAQAKPYVEAWDRQHADKLQYELCVYLAAAHAVKILENS